MARPTRQINIGESIQVPFPSVSANSYNPASNPSGDMHLFERRRTPSLWRSALSATKGLFSASSAATGNSVQQDEYKAILDQLPSPSALVQSFSEKQASVHSHLEHASSSSVRKSRSSPSLKNGCSVQKKQSSSATTSISDERQLPPLPLTRNATSSTRRLLISSPTLPRRLEAFDIQAFGNSDLIPNEFGSYSDCRFASNTSVIEEKTSVSDDNERVSSNHEAKLSRPSRSILARSSLNRRRSLSAPRLDAKCGLQSPGNILPSKVKRAISRPQLRPSPSFSSVSSQNSFAASLISPPFSPKLFNAPDSPVHSISSVKRKPVPRLDFEELLQDPTCSVPTSPLASTRGAASGHIVSSEQNMGSVVSKTLAHDNISVSAPSDSAESYSRDLFDRTPVKSKDIRSNSVSLPSSTLNVDSVVHALTPAPPRRPAKHTMDTPPSSRSGTLSPLTVDDLDAMKTFLRQHDTGVVARQHRKKSLPSDDDVYNDLPSEILQSYLDLDLSLPHNVTSSRHTSSSSFLCQDADIYDDDDIGSLITVATRDDPEIETPVDPVYGANIDVASTDRGTFGCCGLGITSCTEQNLENPTTEKADEYYHEGVSEILRSLHFAGPEEHQPDYDDDPIEGPDPEYTFPPRVENVSNLNVLSSDSLDVSKRFSANDAPMMPPVLVIPPRKSSLPNGNISSSRLIGRPIAQFDWHEGNSDSMGNIDPYAGLRLGSRAGDANGPDSSASRNKFLKSRSFEKLKLHDSNVALYSTTSVLDSSMPVFRAMHSSSESFLDGTTPTKARPGGCDFQERVFSHTRYYDSSSAEELDDGVATPPQLIPSSFMNITPEEEPSCKWPEKTQKRLRSLFSRSVKLQ